MLIEWCQGVTAMPREERRKEAGTIIHDSRKIRPGDVFVALKPENNDGHAFIESAFENGAVAVIAAKKAYVDVKLSYEKRIIRVSDPLRAIQRAAQLYRKYLGILVVGVTGSSGKTTTRRFISAVLGSEYVVGETYTNWNNHIGVPLSLLKFNAQEWLGVIEMGANHCNEISRLSKIVRPDIGVITNIGYAHVGLFGSLAHTTTAKFEIVDGLNRKDGFLLLNGDDPRLIAEAKRRKIPAFFYGCSRRCSVRADRIFFDAENGISFFVDGSAFRLRMPGRHFIYSALPAVFLGRRCGISDEVISRALAEVRPVDMRGTIERRESIDFIVDCYNANPSSMKSALVYLNDCKPKGRKIAVVGEMLELGKYSGRLHFELGRAIARSGVDRLIAVGPSSEKIIRGAFDGGMKASSVKQAQSAVEALPLVRKTVRQGDTVLVKGSRGVHLETIVENFSE